MCTKEELKKQLDKIPAEFSYPGCDSLRQIHETLHGKPIHFIGATDIQSPLNRASYIAIGFASDLKASNPYAQTMLDISRQLLQSHEGVINHKL